MALASLNDQSDIGKAPCAAMAGPKKNDGIARQVIYYLYFDISYGNGP